MVSMLIESLVSDVIVSVMVMVSSESPLVPSKTPVMPSKTVMMVPEASHAMSSITTGKAYPSLP